MTEKNYNKQILKRIEKSIDNLMPVGALIAAIGIVNVYLTGRDVILAVYDVVLAFSLMVLYLNRKRMQPEYKIFAIVMLLFILAFLSLLLTGIIGIGPQLLILSSVIIVGFFPKRFSAVFSIIKTLLLIVFVGLIQFGVIRYVGIFSAASNKALNWYMVIILISLIDWVMIFVIHAIKKFLISMIKTSNVHVNKIYELAFYDSLSKLPNKQKVLDYFQTKTLVNGIAIQFSLDGLSMMNTIYGVKMTDQYIKKLADNLRKMAQSENYIARLSGNEFLWMMEDITENQSLAKYQALVDQLQEYEKEQHARQIVNFSAGYLVLAEGGIQFTAILEKIAIALEQGKLHHALKPCPYNIESERQFLDQEELKSALITGIKEKVFKVFYQEKMDTYLGSISGVEALARWERQQGEFVSPALFVPLLKKINATLEFDLMITEQVFKEYPKLIKKYDQNLTVSINISPVSIITQSFIDQVINLSDRYEMLPERVYFELTEDAFFENLDEANQGIDQLRAKGFKISIDDFGSGYTALSYIFKLRFDELKMDRSFIQQLANSNINSAILKTLLNLRESYGYSLVAEGVETQTECEHLQQMGCWQIQGYLFSKPCPLAEKVVKDES